MLTVFIKSKLKKARFERMNDGKYFGSIPEVKGVWATGKTIPTCKKELREVLEEWLFLQIADHMKMKKLIPVCL